MITSGNPCSAVYLFCDIRGFSAWMATNQMEASDLLDRYYSAAFEHFGERKEQKYPKRVAKLLWDGFLVVHEYDTDNERHFDKVVGEIATASIVFCIDFYGKLLKSTIHNKRNLHCAFGLSYGKGVRINIPGYPLDYISDRINYASRLVGVARDNEVVFEKELFEHITPEEVFSLRKEKRELKKIGPHEVGVFDTVAKS